MTLVPPQLKEDGDLQRADRIGEFWGYPQSHAFAELLIDGEKVRTLRAVLVGMLDEIGGLDVAEALGA